MRRLVAPLLIRLTSRRLFGKPLQMLGTDDGVTILDLIVSSLRCCPSIAEIGLAIAEGNLNAGLIDVAKAMNLPYVLGSEEDGLARLIACAEMMGATDVMRMTPENPFVWVSGVEQAWQHHLKTEADVTACNHVPYGCDFQIYRLDSLRTSHRDGSESERSAWISRHVLNHPEKFRITILPVPEHLDRQDLRVSVDTPEDLILCRHIYTNLRSMAPDIPLKDLINFLDSRAELKNIVANASGLSVHWDHAASQSSRLYLSDKKKP